MMLERHDKEQFFWDDATIARLADIAERFERPCCLSAPMLGVELEKRGVECVTFDCDERFAFLRGFRAYDLYRPQWQNERFGLIICDPPFWNVSLSQLFAAVRMLAHHDTAQPLLLCYLTRRATNVCGTFASYGLEPTGFHPTYCTVANLERNDIEFFGNLGVTHHEALAGV